MASETRSPVFPRLARANLRQRKPGWAWLVWVAGMLIATGANAHLVSLGLGSIHVRAQDAVVLIGVPAAAFTGADDDGDGLLQPSEIKVHRTEILEQLARTFHLSVGGQVAFVREALLMTSVHAEDGVSTPQLEWWSLLEFAAPAQPTDCTEVELHWFTGTNNIADGLVYTLQFQHKDFVQTAAFSKAQSRHSFQCAADKALVLH